MAHLMPLRVGVFIPLIRDSLEMASRELSKFIDEFQIVKTDDEKANLLNQCIRYLAQNCVSNLQLSQLANCQSELTQLDPVNLHGD